MRDITPIEKMRAYMKQIEINMRNINNAEFDEDLYDQWRLANWMDEDE